MREGERGEESRREGEGWGRGSDIRTCICMYDRICACLLESPWWMAQRACEHYRVCR